MTLLRVQNLVLRAGDKTLVDGLSFHVAPEEILAIVGASGAGKTLCALSVLELLPPGITGSADELVLGGVDVRRVDARGLRGLRGGAAGLIAQEPAARLNPLQRAGDQIAEALALHKFPRRRRRDRVLNLLRETGFEDPARIAACHPHMLSGGQIQRVMIAIALANDPRLLIADEPTTGLDVLQEHAILELLARQRKARGLAVLLITHDLALVRRFADRVLVIDQGRFIETGATRAVFTNPLHSVTRRLLAARAMAPPPPMGDAPAVLEVRNLQVSFPVARGLLRRRVTQVVVVNDVSFALRAGETLGLVGASGAGKSSIALALTRLIAYRGLVTLDGEDLARLRGKRLRAARAGLQILFQDCANSLAPRLTAGEIIAEGLSVHAPRLSAADRREMLQAVMRETGLPAAAATRYPHEFSGGQRQRIALARALILRPRVLILDEPTSAVDTTGQAELLHLLREMQIRHGLAYLFISHDLKVIRALAHRIIVLQAGAVIESGPAAAVLSAPQTAYTQSLMAAAGLDPG